MKLIYFWVEKYKVLNNFELNLDSNYEVETKNMGTKNSIIKINKNKIPNIYGENILGVTALVGKNGSGKSSILELLSLDKSGLDSKIVYIYSTNIEYEYIIETNFLYLNNFKDIGFKEDNTFKKYIYKYNSITGEKILLSKRKEGVRIIRYKPNMKKGFQNNSSSYNILRHNISPETDYLEIFQAFQKKEEIFKEYKNTIFKIMLNEYLTKNYDLEYRSLKLVETLKSEEEIREVTNFFLKKECNNINITNNKERFIDNYLTYNININFKEIIDEYLIISEKNNAKDILKSIELSPILISDISNPEKLKELKDKLINQNSNEKKEEILEKTWSFLKNIKYLKNDMLNKYYENIVNQNFEKIKEFLKFIQNLDDQFFIDENTISFNFTQSYSENQQNKILNILKWINKLPDQNSENYEMLERITNFFYSTLEGLSDGEKMYVNIFSSIRKLISEEILSSIVLLDEVELYLHPEWMRRILNMYIKHLSKIKNHKFQLIFATHSPFIISDLPKECVILLEKGVLGTESKKCEIKTFGANIFDLYSETFFLSSTFGEFATKKIVEILNMEEITKENEEVIDYIVDSVGEKLIRSQLKKLLENKKRI